MNRAQKFGLAVIILLGAVYTCWAAVYAGTSDNNEQQVSENRPALNASRIIEIINTERANRNVGALKTNEQATLAAQEKCNDMIANNYYDHINPDTGKHGYDYAITRIPEGRTFNENMTQGPFKSEQDVVNAWLDSTPHKETMLDSTYTDTGIAICHLPMEESDTQTIVQEFIRVPVSTLSSREARVSGTSQGSTSSPSTGTESKCYAADSAYINDLLELPHIDPSQPGSIKKHDDLKAEAYQRYIKERGKYPCQSPYMKY